MESMKTYILLACNADEKMIATECKIFQITRAVFVNVVSLNNLNFF